MYRMVIAVASLISGLVALYLHLWKLGLAGSLACTGNHGCEIAQMSSYGWFLGVDVALIGTIGYSLIFIVAIVGTLGAFEDARWPTLVLLGLILPALLFTIRLKYAEFVILRTFCPWCAVSAVTITLCTVLAWLDWRARRSASEAPVGGALHHG
ncbi:MAG: vitamin K epoxide reductase family protein [Gemmatimonadaceae bacterium]|nr:vitamin K epoxide reductase family protein [Gemmatimonadaceae bacterium]